jgi:hypothetical protein
MDNAKFPTFFTFYFHRSMYDKYIDKQSPVSIPISVVHSIKGFSISPRQVRIDVDSNLISVVYCFVSRLIFYVAPTHQGPSYLDFDRLPVLCGQVVVPTLPIQAPGDGLPCLVSGSRVGRRHAKARKVGRRQRRVGVGGYLVSP